MINFSEISGNSGKNFVLYNYKNKEYKCSIKKDGTLDIIVEHKIRKFDFCSFIIIPTIFQCFLLINHIFSFLIPIFITLFCYLRLKLSKQVRQFHAAEHKVINALENGLDLEYINIISQPSYAYRCGGSLIVNILIISLIISLVGLNPFLAITLNIVIVFLTWKFKEGNNMFIKIARCVLTPTSKFMQKHFTTFKPENKHIEVAMLAMKTLIAEHSKYVEEKYEVY